MLLHITTDFDDISHQVTIKQHVKKYSTKNAHINRKQSFYY